MASTADSKKIELIGLLEEAKRREAETLYLKVFNSFYGWQKDFVKATIRLIDKEQTGFFHVVGTDYDNRFNFSKKVCDAFGFKQDKIHDSIEPLEKALTRLEKPTPELISMLCIYWASILMTGRGISLISLLCAGVLATRWRKPGTYFSRHYLANI